ncbi:hypothetical protein [Promicromonospora iranensis]|uniref:Uncharacterized protein YrrD n=1 Tax=Promicromonospora iranensis TaxID=1105144 RepID=A0ABU2CUR0_9MICO|nr:hypothetical protein [Promicromonospora iranensis]MDR7385064.1 uncharacterized protein YrrD [Promicromonospora iranensis]
MTEFTGPTGPIRDVTTGMTVVDASGETVGTVDEVHLADAGAATGAGQSPDEPGGPVTWIADAFRAGSELNQQAQDQLTRVGYIRVDARGLFSGHRYVEPREIASVVGDQVQLSVAADQLLK